MNETEKEYNLDRLSAFEKRLKDFLRKRLTSKQDLEDLIAELNVNIHIFNQKIFRTRNDRFLSMINLSTHSHQTMKRLKTP